MIDEERLAEIQEIFDHYDRDGNGVVDPAEFATLCRALDGEFSDEEIALGLEAIDRNNNGMIELEEFVGWWSLRYE